VLTALAADGQTSVDLATWHALHEWLGFSEHRVVLPFASRLVRAIPPVAVRLRRDVRQVLELVKAHALLHRATRARDETGRIVATLADYAVVRWLVEPLVAAGVGATVPPAVRETVAAVQRCGGKEVTVKQVASQLILDPSAAWRRVQRALADGYLVNREDRDRRPARLSLSDPLPADALVLPHPRDLRNDCANAASHKGTAQPPSPPSLDAAGCSAGGDDEDSYEVWDVP
jgi:hypothetical protein